jgi:hypothetical protein
MRCCLMAILICRFGFNRIYTQFARHQDVERDRVIVSRLVHSRTSPSRRSSGGDPTHLLHCRRNPHLGRVPEADHAHPAANGD